MIKIAIIGPESTGKTALASKLASHFNAEWVAEYAREYVESLDRPYDFDDLCMIARKQIELEKSYENISKNQPQLVFFDTELIITKVWFSHCYKTIPEFVTNRLNEKFFDLYLLCLPDIPWEPDPVREHGDDREFFFDWYKREIEQTGTPYVIIGGLDSLRLTNAITAINQWIKSKQQN